MNRTLKITLCFAIAICLIASVSSAATKKVSRRKAPSLTAEQKALLLKSKSPTPSGSVRSAKAEKSTSKAIIEITKALARSHSASEVLTLNLTNLLILIVLKAIIFGIGLFYFGGVSFKGGYKHEPSHHHGYSRGLDGKSNSPFMTEGEIMLMLTYLLGSTTDDYTCFHRVACEHPSSAKSYLKVSKMMLKGAKFAQNYVSYNPKYDNVLGGLETALNHRSSGGDCAVKYTCSDIPHL